MKQKHLKQNLVRLWLSLSLLLIFAGEGCHCRRRRCQMRKAWFGSMPLHHLRMAVARVVQRLCTGCARAMHHFRGGRSGSSLWHYGAPDRGLPPCRRSVRRGIVMALADSI